MSPSCGAQFGDAYKLGDAMIERIATPARHLPLYAPGVHGRNRHIHRVGDGRLPAGLSDLIFDRVIHDAEHAIIARDLQSLKCDNRHSFASGNLDVCGNVDSTARGGALQRGMDMLAVKRRMQELGLTQLEVAAHLRIDPSAVSKLLSGRRQLKAQEAARLSQLLDLDELGFTTIRHIPVIGFVSAGQWQEFIEQPLYMMPSPTSDLPLRAFGVVVEGDSMNRVVVDGATLIVDPDDLDLVAKGIYVISNGDGLATVKQFMTDPARLEPMSTNSNHMTIFPGRDRFMVVGRVIWKAERLR